MEIIKIIIAIILLGLAGSGCGMKAGGVVVGTTGFLAEANRAGVPLDYYTAEDKTSLAAVIEQEDVPAINLHSWRAK